MKSSKIKHSLTADTRTPRTIFMNYHGYTQEDIVECWFCHAKRPMAQMTVHHMLEQRLCRMYPWHHDKLRDPAWLFALCGGADGCHECHFNMYFHQSVQATLDLLDVKQRKNQQARDLHQQITSLKAIIAGKATQNTNAQLTKIQLALEKFQEDIGVLNIALEAVKS